MSTPNNQPSLLDQVADDATREQTVAQNTSNDPLVQAKQSTQAPIPQPTQAPASSGSLLDQVAHDAQMESQNPANDQAAAAKAAADRARQQVAQHGLLRRAWDFINSPIADLSIAGHRLLPEGVKTSDIIKAAAFEKMYGEAYIPGFNDFDTKAEAHFGSAPAKMTTKDGHPYVAPPEAHAFKNAVRTFVAGVGKDTSDMAAGFTSPVGIATTVAGFGPEAKAGTALAKAATAGRVLTGTAFGLKGASDIYQAGLENTPEAWQQRLQGTAEVAGGAALAKPVAEPIARVTSKVTEPVETLTKQVVKGERIAQPQAEAALRRAASTGSREAGVSTVQPQSLRTVLEDPIESLETQAKSQYKQIDRAAGTDFKALNDKLSNTEYQIRQLTETEEDVAKEAALEKSRSALIDKIEAAKQEAIKNGVDPKVLDAADESFKQANALKDVEAKVFKNTGVVKGNIAHATPETVNVDSAVKALQKLQDTEKFSGSRLEQAFGKEGAAKVLDDMYAAQRAGVKAMTRQQWAARIAKLGLTAGGLAVGGHVLHAALTE